MKYIHIPHSKILSVFVKMLPIIFATFFLVGCSAFQLQYETEVKEMVPVGYKYIHYDRRGDYGADAYLMDFLSLRKVETIYRVKPEEQSQTLLAEVYMEEGVVFPPATVYQSLEPLFYIPKIIEFKIYDYSTKKLFAVVKYERGMFRYRAKDEELKFFAEFKKIFINYKPLFDPYEGSY